ILFARLKLEDVMEKVDAQRKAHGLPTFAELEAQEKAEAEAAMQQAEVEGWDASGLQDDWGEDAKGMRMYSCPSCGAELFCEETTAATSCPYCDNPTIVPGQFSGVLKPDYIIPFKLGKEDALKALKEHYKGRPFLPKAFQNQNHLDEIKGVYVPFWLFDGKAEGSVSFEGTNIVRYNSGDYEVTETHYYDVYRAGSLAFERIPVDGSKKMPDDYMDSLEPFDYDGLKDFSTAYLPGYLADKYDVSAEESSQRADSRAEATVSDALKDTVYGYQMVFEKQRNIQLHRGEVKYALLPVWILNTTWNGEKYMFAMNGQTGKMVGDLPTDKKKKWGIFGIVYLITLAITALFILFPFGLLDLLRM
ncbi:MAG: hypothetical protein Q4C06_07910, partial [Bacillota bacterium]|nr:hypothetical protein [Bacillota bacterium]